MFDRLEIFLRKKRHDREKITTYILDDNHYIIVEPKWSNINTYYCICRYYINTVWGESYGGIGVCHTKKELKKYIKDNKLRVPSEDEMKMLMSLKEYRVRIYLDFAELEDTTLTEEEEEFLNKEILLL